MPEVLPAPVKSAQDERNYRVIKLENDLTCILVQDPDCDKAAAAMDVGVGHFSDPAELPGLAHFLEHMLFMGTEKYPDENEYSVFLSANGGQSNAYTSMENTNYYFDVKHEELEGALDRFAQFFIAPLFTETATKREIQAVNNENSNNLLNDHWRIAQLLKSTSDPSHAFSKFGTGNISTLMEKPALKGIDTREALLAFHEKYYSSNISKLCIIGREPLDTLEEWAVEKFSPFVNKAIDAPKFAPAPLHAECLAKTYKILPVKDLRDLTLIWSLPEIRSIYQQKPTSCISHLLGHEGEGSVLELLKAKGWANGLSAGYGHNCTSFSTFSCHVELTEEGLKHTDDIVYIIFQYMHMLQKASDADLEMLIDEQIDIDNMNFRFKSKESPFNYCSRLAKDLQIYPSADVLRAYNMLKRDIQTCKKFVDLLLVPTSCRLHLVSHAYESETNIEEEWYGTKYAVEAFSDDMLKMLHSPKPHPKLFLPEKNEFIATDFESKGEGVKESKHAVILDKTPLKCWWKYDDIFNKPKANVIISLDTPMAYSSPRVAIMSKLFLSLLTDSMASYSYDCDLAGLVYDIVCVPSGVDIVFRGYNDKLMILLKRVLQKMKTFDETVSEDRFALIKDDIMRQLADFRKEQPYQHALLIGRLCTETVWSPAERLAALEDVSYNELKSHIRSFFREGANIEMLVHGNVSEAGAREIVETVNNSLQLKPLSPSLVPDRRLADLPTGILCKAKIEAYNTDETNSAILDVVHLGVDSKDVTLAAYTNMLSHIFEEPSFNTLRTTEQLGYLVWSGGSNRLGVLIFQMIIQSTDHSAEYLHSRADAFVQNTFYDFLKAMDEEEFNKNKDSVIAIKMEKDKTLNQHTDRIWTEISKRRYDFDRVNTEVAVLKSLTKEKLLTFYEDHIKNKNRRKMISVQIEGHRPVDAEKKEESEAKPVIVEESVPVRNINNSEFSSFKASLPLHSNIYISY